MPVSIHAMSAPLFLRMLQNMNTWLDKAEAHATAKKFDVNNLLQARLAPDMIDLAGQYRIATAWAKNGACRLANQTPPDFPDTDKTLAELRARNLRTSDILSSLNPKDFAGSDERMLTVPLGPEIKLNVSGTEYLFNLTFTNFYFHVTTAYAILRHNGVELGKGDFLAGAVNVPGR